MSLLNPTPGEMIDRLAILKLKIPAAQAQQKDPKHFLEEQAALSLRLKEFEQGVIETLAYSDDAAFSQWVDKVALIHRELGAINSVLWHQEDQVRELPTTSTFRLAVIAKSIAINNDRRADLIREATELYGIETQYEKLYTEKVR